MLFFCLRSISSSLSTLKLLLSWNLIGPKILCLVIIIIIIILITGDHSDHATRGGGPPRPRQPHRQAHLRLLHPGHVGRPRPGFYFRFRQEQDHQVQAIPQTGELFNSFLAPSGAQGVTMAMSSCYKQLLNIISSLSAQDQTEPKIHAILRFYERDPKLL